MSKKTITFTLPPSRAAEPEAGPAGPPAADRDEWVFATERDAPHAPEPGIDNAMLIDLSARRSWFELVQLIWAFPVLATWCWMANVTGTLPARNR